MGLMDKKDETKVIIDDRAVELAGNYHNMDHMMAAGDKMDEHTWIVNVVLGNKKT